MSLFFAKVYRWFLDLGSGDSIVNYRSTRAIGSGFTHGPLGTS
jgi:hypothetical protein